MKLHVPTWPNYPPQRAPDRGLATIVLAHQRRHRLARGITLGDLLPLAGVERLGRPNLLPWALARSMPA